MANLRVDNLTGTGGRNAIDGSVFFDGNGANEVGYGALSLVDSTDWYLDGDFTFECWIKSGKAASASGAFLGQWQSGGGTNRNVQLYWSSNGVVTGYMNRSTTNYSAGSVAAVTRGVWHHVALVLESTTLRFYLNGVQTQSATVSGTENNSAVKFWVGGEDNGSGFPVYGFNGYLSNVRVVKGTAVYTGGTTFTPPTEKLTAVAGTVLLCCQDSDNPTQEATGKTIAGYASLGGDNTEGNLLTNTLDWSPVSSTKSAVMPTGWTAGNSAQAKTESGGQGGSNYGGSSVYLRMYNDGGNSYIYQTIPTVIGQLYQIDLWYHAHNTNLGLEWKAGTSADGTQNGNQQWTNGSNGNEDTQSGTFIASATTTYITLRINSSTTSASVGWDKVQVKAVNPKYPKVLPSVGVDGGIVLEGETTFNSPNYMYFPTGDTAQRGRGRGLNGGSSTPSNITNIDYFQIQSTGNSIDFGDLTVAGQHTACSSTTRGVFAMGSNNNTIDYVTIATTANAVNFGDRTVALNGPGALANNTRGVFLGGGSPNPQSDVMDYITIASEGNATDFGNMSSGNKNACGLASPTRGCIAHGGDPLTNTIDYITIATAGNATDFGDTTNVAEGYLACASNIRGIIVGGYVSPSGNVNTIQYITIATTGNAADFGDLGSNRVTAQSGAGTSNNLRGVTMGGFNSPNQFSTTMEYVTIASTGNSSDFGYLTSSRAYTGSCSDSHGGLS